MLIILGISVFKTSSQSNLQTLLMAGSTSAGTGGDSQTGLLRLLAANEWEYQVHDFLWAASIPEEIMPLLFCEDDIR